MYLSYIHSFITLQNEAGRSSSPVENLGTGSEGLSHIMFEKDHLIATLQSSLDQANQEKLGLSEQVTNLQRLAMMMRCVVGCH